MGVPSCASPTSQVRCSTSLRRAQLLEAFSGSCLEMHPKEIETMATTVKVGSIFIQNRPLILRTLGLESEPYEGTWDVLHSLPSGGLDQKIRGSGWNYFFMAAEVRE